MKSVALQRLAFMVYAHLAAVIGGVLVVTSDDISNSLKFGVLMWSMGFAMVLACVADAKLRKRPIVRIAQLVMLFCWPIAVPAYSVVARRWIGVLWALLFAFTLMVCYSVGIFAVVLFTEVTLESLLEI
ncbi:MAG: hypothetical protein AAGH99_15545 [Planctomycetota bacterium]